MIVNMDKLLVAVRAAQKDDLLASLRRQGVVHLTPVDEAVARPDEKITATIQRLARAEQILSSIEPAGDAPDLGPVEAAERVLTLFNRAGDLRSKLAALHREAEHVGPWGDAKLATFAALRDAGLTVRVFVAPPEAVGAIQGECVERVGRVGEKELVILARHGEAADAGELPESVEELELPPRDRPTILAEAKGLDEQLKADAEELTHLANGREAMAAERARWEADARYAVADRGGLGDDALYAVQGWAPVGEAQTIAAGMRADGIDGAVEVLQPAPEDAPPTLIRYPKWAKPIKGLFDILGTLPGYREYDLAPFFMLALPIFAAMLIGDAGYGLLFTVLPLVFYRKLAAKVGKAKVDLILTFGVTTVIWGVLTATYFGLTPPDMAAAGWGSAAKAMESAGLLYRSDSGEARNLVIMISFLLGAAHLVSGQLRQALGVAPNIRALANVGWALFLVGMLGVIWQMFFPDRTWMSQAVMLGLLAVGGGLVVLFTYPSKNPAKMLGMGVIANILPMIGTFSDTMSYIRLMAVGMASYYIANSFNALGASVAGGSSWILGAPIIIFGHLLNIALAMIAIFAHGVRLNMLEFSNNAGVQWTGYPYAPFATAGQKEEM